MFVSSWVNSTNEQYFVMGKQFCIAPNKNGHLGAKMTDDVNDTSFSKIYTNSNNIIDLIYNPKGYILNNSTHNYRLIKRNAVVNKRSRQQETL